jgi:signal transduction histidine kinase
LAIERLIALLRVSLTIFCLVDFSTLENPGSYDRSIFAFVLIAYAVFGLVVAWFPIIGKIRTGWQLPVHVIDIGVVSYLMYFSRALSSTFFALYVFVLLSATFRWNWRGAIWTTALVFVLDVILFQSSRTAPFLIQSAFLLIVGGMFAFFGVGRQHSADRLDKIAAWPGVRIQTHEPVDHHWLDSSLAHIANALEVPRILVLWEITKEPYAYVSLFANGECWQERTSTDLFDGLVAGDLDGTIFASESLDSQECFTSTGNREIQDWIINRVVASKFEIASVCSAPFSADNCRGRVFLLDRPHWGQDYLTLVGIVAARLCIELEYYAICIELEETATSRERIRLSRDLHDGTLQSLTAAALQLKMISDRSGEDIQNDIDVVRRLILSEQRRIRAFVDGRQPLLSAGPIKIRNVVQRTLKKLERQWKCKVKAQSIEPQDAMVSDETARQIEFLIAEAVANAVHHGEASSINIAIEQTRNELSLQVIDNGNGLPGIMGKYDQAELASLGIGPQSILKRINSLRGKMSLISSSNGVELLINLRCADVGTSVAQR